MLSGFFSKPYVTNSSGEINLTGLDPGVYLVQEVNPNNDYVVNSTPQEIEIKAGDGTKTLVFLNYLKPGIYLIKLDSETLKPLVNARFRISLVGGSFDKEYYTDASGEIDLTGLDPGAYTVEELAAPDGYLIDDAIRTIQINGGENALFVFTNTKKPVLEVLKFDGEIYLPGATFRIAKIEDGSHYLDRITDENGRIRIEDLEPGIYSVQEMQAPSGYILNDYEYHVELFPGKTSQLVVTNVKKPDLQIVKTDANTGEPIEGVTYTVKKVDSSTLETVRTDANGEAWMYELDEGVYQITEQSVPSGYILDTTPQLITLVGGKTGVARFQNYPKPKLRILKVDAVTGEPLANAEFRVSKVDGGTVSEYITDSSGEIIIENLDVARYRVEEFMAPDGYLLYDEYKEILLEAGKTSTIKFDDIRKPTLIITKTNALTYEPIPNTTYQIQYEQSDGGVYTLGTYRTDSNGQIIIKNADPGWYVITETLAAPGFSLSSNPVTRKYLAPGENAYANSDNVSGDVSGSNIQVTSGNDYITLGVEIYDYPLNSIVIRKVDANTGELLAGAAFEVRQVTGDISGSSGTLIGRYTTDNSGIIIITGLTAGGYIVEEVQAPANYLLTENAQQQVWLKSDGTSIVEATFANFPYGGILITKVDASNNQPLANARFRVTDSSGAVVGNSNGEYITDASGEILVPDVKPGSYVITEIEAPEYYSIDTTPQTITVGTDGGIYKVSFKNQPSATIVIRKLDTDTKEPLSGAEFKVTDSSGAVVGTGNGIYTTDATGTITIPHLKKGSYIITETAAPSGYVLENNTQTVAVDYGKTYTVDIYNSKMSGVQIIKIDADSKQPLKGAKFTVYRMDGGVVGAYETNGDGVIIISALEPGWYKAAETSAPDGYIIDDTPQDFQITANQFIKLTFENKALASLQIKKVDEITGAALSGATFEVRKQDGSYIGEYTTDTDGTISIPAVEPGWYIVSETKAPTGYILDSTAKTVEVKATVPTVVTFTNKALSGLQIIKLNSVTRQPIEGAEFAVARMNGERVGTYKTNSSGIITISGLESGWYTVSEVKAATGYILDAAPQNVEIKWGKSVTLEITNTPISGLLIIKTDASTGKALAGVKFEVKKANGEQVGIFTTDSSGRIYVTDIPAGKYVVVETAALDGYVLDSTAHEVTVYEGKQAVLEVANSQLAGLRLVKIDSITKKPIYNVEFMVFDANNKVVGTYYTDNNGVIDFSGILPEGRYTIRETRAAAGYYLDEVPKTVEFVSGKVTEIVWTNTPQMAQIQILKKSGDDNEVNGLPAGTPLAGAIFEVYEYKSGNMVDRFVSGSDGRAVSASLPLGRYIVKEVQAPLWYKLSDKTLDVELEFATQIVKLEYLNYSANTGVYIKKTGPAECMPGDTISYTIRSVQNIGSVPLTDFYWRDTLPTDAVRLTKIVTGTFNQSLKYKVIATINTGETMIIADNLSTTKNNVIDCSNASLGLASNQYVTSVTFMFGTVKAGFAQVITPQIFVKVLSTLPNGYQFSNKADVGGKYYSEWVVSSSTTLCTVYSKPSPLPRTGY